MQVSFARNVENLYAKIKSEKREGNSLSWLFMLREKVLTSLKIRPDEMRMAALVAVLFLVVQAGQGFGDTAAFAIFVSQNVDRLPYMYASQACRVSQRNQKDDQPQRRIHIRQTVYIL